jgi:Flp pilus assembly protein TadG
MRSMQHVRRLRHAPGQTLVLFALMSLMLIAGLGLVIDAGVDYAARRRMQNAADTAALAGTRVIARQVTTPTLKRPDVWSAVFGTAVANGVPNDASRFTCDFIDNARNALNQPCSDNGNPSIPSNATGVRVRVTEQHTTFFMRALGITTSGTAATSTAQVQAVRELSVYDIPFMVCGVYSPNGIEPSILDAKNVDATAAPSSPSPKPQMTVPQEDPARIRESAYSYDWNVREPNGDLKLLNPTSPAPEYLVYSENMPQQAQCSLDQVASYSGSNQWHGLISHPKRITTKPQVYTINNDADILPFIRASHATLATAACESANPPDTTGPVTIACPEHDINGTRGCPAGQIPNDCIIPLPIVASLDPSPYSSNPDKLSGDLLGRFWGVFWIKRYWNSSTSSYDYRGRLIKNYPLHVNGVSVWSPTYPNASYRYGGPVTVNLVR